MTDLAAPPVLSTPDQHILELPADDAAIQSSTLSAEALSSTYEIPHTATKIADGKWKRIALQFPDYMLVDAPRVVEALHAELDRISSTQSESEATPTTTTKAQRKIYILADTSYSACCVDEIAAEHASADVVVHYGRTCLSPTSRLPTILIYTHHELDHENAFKAFEKEFPGKASPVVVMADLTYQDHVEDMVKLFSERGYTNIAGTSVHRNPDGIIPNRNIESGEPISDESLKSYHLFHISTPPSALLLSLSSRFASLHILPTTSSSASLQITNPTIQTAALLRRRFARLLKLSTASIIGILVNTLSVSNYLPSIDILRQKIDRAGKKSYTIVVGKLNPAKLANFSEIDGWVVVGCWESGLIEDEAGEYWKPVITPFELEVALMKEEERIWGVDWWGGMERLRLDDVKDENEDGEEGGGEYSDDDEDAPPEFDLRTGKLISHTRPMRKRKVKASAKDGNTDTAQSLIQRKPGDLATINGVVSPGAEFLRSQRTWQGLGSDFASIDAENEAGREESTVIEEGRSGIARGYQVSEGEKH